MTFHLIAIFIFLLCSISSTSQSETLLDPRDGNLYPIELIDDTWWFSSNLKFETQGSHCPTTSIKDCTNGNYYPYTELLKVCPPGWHVSTKADWDRFITYRAEQQEINGLTITTYDSDGEYDMTYTETVDTSNLLALFDEDAPMKLKKSGWVQGKRKQIMKGITLWAINSVLDNDLKFHLHIGDHSYVEHTHDHHIVDKPKRVRKFSVRCVKN